MALTDIWIKILVIFAIFILFQRLIMGSIMMTLGPWRGRGYVVMPGYDIPVESGPRRKAYETHRYERLQF